MDTVEFLELLAIKAHHQNNLKNLVHLLPDKIKDAFLVQDGEYLKLQLSSTEHFANESHVVLIQL